MIATDVGSSECLDVWVQPSAMDYKLTEGLCGSYDGNSTNDRETGEEFSISWRLGVILIQQFLSSDCTSINNIISDATHKCLFSENEFPY